MGGGLSVVAILHSYDSSDSWLSRVVELTDLFFDHETHEPHEKRAQFVCGVWDVFDHESDE